MNCQEFEGYLVDLAGERVESESLRASLLQHAGQCSRCASRIAAHRNLASGLRALAAKMAVEKASDQVKQALRQQLRQRVNPTTTSAKASAATTPWQRTATWAGLAASVLVLVGWALVQRNRESGMDKVQVVQAPRAATDSRVKTAGPAVTATQEKLPQIVPRLPRPVKTRPPHLSKAVAEQRVQVASRESRRSEQRLSESESGTADRVETEFLPFMAVGPQFPSEQRQFVRVKLPRSALQVFGLPMNMERLREPVQADVLLGEDGRALAVRFVRD